MTPMDNENRLYLWNKDEEWGASEAKGPHDDVGGACLSVDHLPLGLNLKYKIRQTPTGGCKKAHTDGPGAWGLCWGTGAPWAVTRGSLCASFSRREDKLRIQNGWLCHLAPEIIRQLSPDTEEDKLPFSKHSDVFALG